MAGGGTGRMSPLVRDHHRRCASALADLSLLAACVDGDALSPRAVRRMNAATACVLDELRGAMAGVVEALADTGSERPAVNVLEGRLERSRTAAGEIAAALSCGDLPSARRHIEQFRILVAAMWKIQLDLHGSVREAGDVGTAARHRFET